MTRPLRIEFEGALYHVTARGDRKQVIYEDDRDRLRFMGILGDVATEANWICHAYCLMPNHYHLVIETPDANLARGMRQLNGIYTQGSNRRHERVGHLFQGRYKAVLVDSDPYLLQLTRYVALNPVRAKMVAHPREWPWSSYQAMLDHNRAPAWLAREKLLAHFSNRETEAIQRYEQFVAAGIGKPSIWHQLNRQIYLGDDHFVAKMLRQDKSLAQSVGTPVVQRRSPPPSLETLSTHYKSRDESIVAAYATGEYSYQQIAAFHGLHYTSVGKIVRRARGGGRGRGQV